MGVVFSPDTDDSGAGLDGTIHNNAWKQAMAAAINAVLGDWTPVPFVAGNFQAATGNWTLTAPDMTLNRYQVINKTLFWSVTLDTTTVSATPASLRITIPTGTFANLSQYHHTALLSDNGTVRQGIVRPGDTTHLYIFREDLANFAAATNTTAVYFSGFWELA